MKVSQAIEELRGLLEQERAAIRSLDGASVAAAADAKERLVEILKAASPAELAESKEAIAALRAELLRNGILLAHATDALRAALETMRSTRPSTRLSLSV